MSSSKCPTNTAGKLSEAIQSLDLGAIRFKLLYPEDGPGWQVQRVDRAEILYRRFLYLVGLHPTRALVPTKDIDAFWHAHILDTAKYAADMDAVFGYFLHHFPYFGVRGDADRAAMESAFEQTMALYVRHFGESGLGYKGDAGSGAAFCGGPSCRDIVPHRLDDMSWIELEQRPSA